MSCSCGPSCAKPTCPPKSCCPPCGYPTSGLGSLSCCPPPCCPPPCCPSPCCGGSTTAASLGIVCGANIGCINQLPPSEMVVQPAPCVVTVPGAVLAASCEPLCIGGYTACGSGGCCGLPSCGCMSVSSSCKPSGCHKMTVSKVCSSPC